MPDDKRLIQSIKLQNVLSFGPDAAEIENSYQSILPWFTRKVQSC